MEPAQRPDDLRKRGGLREDHHARQTERAFGQHGKDYLESIGLEEGHARDAGREEFKEEDPLPQCEKIEPAQDRCNEETGAGKNKSWPSISVQQYGC